MSELGSHNGDGIRYALYLSAPKGGVAQMLRDPDGAWVPYEDYTRLKAEVERLRKTAFFVFKEFDEFGQVSASTIAQLNEAVQKLTR
jgi:hypothetical protein